jgi:hypothetical protein
MNEMQNKRESRKEEGVTPSNGNLINNYWIWAVRTGQVRFLGWIKTPSEEGHIKVQERKDGKKLVERRDLWKRNQFMLYCQPRYSFFV